MHTIKLTKREVEAVYNCLEYAYENFDGDMSLMDDDEWHDQKAVIRGVVEKVKPILEERE